MLIILFKINLISCYFFNNIKQKPSLTLYFRENIKLQNTGKKWVFKRYRILLETQIKKQYLASKHLN